MYSLVNLQAHCTIKGFAAGVAEVGLVESLGTLSQFGGNPSYAMHSNSWQDVTKCRQVDVSMYGRYLVNFFITDGDSQPLLFRQIFKWSQARYFFRLY